MTAQTTEPTSLDAYIGQGHQPHLDVFFEPRLKALGYGLIRARYRSSGQGVLSLMIERLDGQGLSISDCTRVTRALQADLEVNDPLKGDYQIEVTSAGVDRPLTRVKDFHTFKGRRIRVKLKQPLSVTHPDKRYEGVIEGSGDLFVRLQCAADVVDIPFMMIDSATLVPDWQASKQPKKVLNKPRGSRSVRSDPVTTTQSEKV